MRRKQLTGTNKDCYRLGVLAGEAKACLRIAELKRQISLLEVGRKYLAREVKKLDRDDRADRNSVRISILIAKHAARTCRQAQNYYIASILERLVAHQQTELLKYQEIAIKEFRC